MKDLWNNSFSSLPVLIGELNFDSTLTGHFWVPTRKCSVRNLPLIKLEIYRLDGQNLTSNETKVFDAIQNLMNVSRL